MVAITPYIDLHSEDILSAHISALQHNINKLETVLDLITTAKTGQPLIAVSDQMDPSLQYKIYEGIDRNWLTTPSPIIYRNGTVVASSEYTLKAAQGSVVFIAQQLPTDVITGDYTMLTGNSRILNSLSQTADTVATNTQNIATNTQNITNNANAIKNQGSPAFHAVGTWRTHMGTVSAPTPQYQTGVSTGTNNMDAFPFWVSEPTNYDAMRVTIGTGAGAKLKMGIYANSNGYPSTKIAETVEGNPSTTGDLILAFSNGNITLQPGMYWLVRWQDASPTLNNCLYNTQALPIGESTDTTNLMDSLSTGAYPIGAIRVTIAPYDSILRSPFPSVGAGGAHFIKRSSYCSPWIRRV